jgi:hypothetical protein
MADQPVAKAPEAQKSEGKKTGPKKRPAGPVGVETKRVEKTAWTLERVKKFARRFESAAAWSEGHPSSFKSARAHGWDKQATFKSNSSPVRQLPKAG